MAEQNKVETLEVCLVAPAVLDPSSLPKSLPLTFFDLRGLRNSRFPQRLYFYELLAPEAFFHSNVLPRLKHSLSLTLGHHFLPVAGKLTWPSDSPRPVLTYSPGDAVPLTVARSYADFSLLTGIDNFVCDATICYPLVPDLPASCEQSLVLAIQATVFPNRGFSIGITNTHVVLDGRSFVTFVKSWAHICRSLGVGGGSDHIHGDEEESRSCLPVDLEPFYDRTLIKDPANLEAIFLNQWLNFEGPNNRSLGLPRKPQILPDLFRGTFQLPPEKLEKLRRLVKAQGIEDKKVVLRFPVDCRSRLEPPLPSTYFGNCLSTGYAVVETELLLREDGFSVAVNAISAGIKKLDNGFLDGAENWVSGFTGSSITPPLGKVFPVASSPRFGYYSTDFGWGKPTKMEAVCENMTGLIFLWDRRNGDAGVGIGLVLKKDHMEAFASLFIEGLESL